MQSRFSAYDHGLSQLWTDHEDNPDNAELLHLLCFGLNLRGHHRQCAQLARIGLVKHQKHTNLYYELLLATSLIAGEELSSMGSEIEALYNQRPGDLGAKRNLALYHFYMENDAESARLLSEILTQFDRSQIDQYTYEVIAQLEHAHEHFETCLEHCDAGLAKQQPAPRLVRIKGLCHLDLNELESARECFEQALELEPDFIWACHSLGSLFFEQGDFASGFAYFGKASAINPTDPNTYFLAAEAFMDQKAFDLAAGELQKLLWLDQPPPIIAEAHNALGYLRFKENQPKQAKHHLSQALEITPHMPVAYYHLGLVAQTEKETDRTRDFFQQAIDLDPDYLDAWVSLGRLYFDESQIEDAEECFQNAASIDPESGAAYLGLSQVSGLQELWDNKLIFARTAVQLDPHQADHWLQLSNALKANDQKQDAFDVLAEALAYPGNHLCIAKEMSRLATELLDQFPEERSKLRQRCIAIGSAYLKKNDAASAAGTHIQSWLHSIQ